MPSNRSAGAGELVSQGAAQASRDPNSTATAQDVEQVMADESKKAGIAAFQFDPNTSPEDKAAQARSVRFSRTIWEFLVSLVDPS